MSKEGVSENVRRVLEKKEKKKLKEEKELYKATKVISSQNNILRKIIAQKQSSSTSFVNKIKDINKSLPHIRSKHEKNYMKENKIRLQETINLQKKMIEKQEELKNKKPFIMKKYKNVTSKVAKNLLEAQQKEEKKEQDVSNKEYLGNKTKRENPEEENQDESVEYTDEYVEEEQEENGQDVDENEQYEEEYEQDEEEYEQEEGEYEQEEEEYEQDEEKYEQDEEKCEQDEEKCEQDEEKYEQDGDQNGQDDEYVEEYDEYEEYEEYEEEETKNNQKKSEKREDDLTTNETKRESSIIDKFKKNKTNEQKNEKLHKNFGKLPNYILKKKKDVSQDSLDTPEGYRVLKNEERNYVLKELHSQLKDIKEEYKNNKDKQKKIQLGKKLKEVKESIEMFSNPYVLVDENF
ncbi:hypothetical protein CYL21_1138 [Plasmodium falciparum NF54]|uniref:Enkurin domain-containing protein n=2 Tax=Plasmodium falciparum TaxID=5833 RepID=Q8I2M8_PLAF7|nr:conserved Plasmodium protein, unknown function [Plasmodium falciparum 3D7]KAF4330762.1 hypothetical protein CYL21_1138 [Plasmodium falciparum NF54]PKC45197.1 hypothetical protein CK202_4196 [Plasmodium falciparum NF54]CAD51962.1 conserved Plasmodium protein, unknown function [Plasmodium falciparum 3D7]|eukprot:XP_001352151.1 conserved Plasmodium protein, unknown function [Plasmodium falciparum 3D7]